MINAATELYFFNLLNIPAAKNRCRVTGGHSSCKNCCLNNSQTLLLSMDPTVATVEM